MKDIHHKQNRSKVSGASMVEYALLIALIAVIALAAVRILGQRVSTRMSSVASAVNN